MTVKYSYETVKFIWIIRYKEDRYFEFLFWWVEA